MLRLLLDALFPLFCLGCRKEGMWLCGECTTRMVKARNFFCIGCKAPAKWGKTCGACRRSHALDGLLSLGHYRERVLREAVQAVKYHGARELARTIAALLHAETLAPWMRERGAKSAVWHVVPVPLHRFRERRRGFNQAALIAEAISRQSGAIYHAAMLRRRIPTFTQANIKNPKERTQNVADAFVLRTIPPPRVLLVDDVATTGSTLEACARALKQAGAMEVWGITVARG